MGARPRSSTSKDARPSWGRDYDKALEFYEQAVAEDPEDPKYLLAASRMRFVAGQTHVETGRLQREQGHLEEAAAEFQRRA